MERGAAALAAIVERFLRFAAGSLLALLLLTVLVAVVSRYGLGRSILGADEAALWMFSALGFLALPLVSTSVLAMRLDLASDRLGPRARLPLDALADAVVVHAALTLLSGSLTATATIGGISPVLGVPESWRFVPVALGAALTVLLLLLRAVAERRWFWLMVSVGAGAALHLLSTNLVLPPVDHPSLVAGFWALLLLLLGAPLPHVLVSGAALALPVGGLLPEAAIVQTTVSALGRFLLLAIPFFLLAGALMTAGGLAERLVRLARSLVGHYRGGLSQTVLLTNAMISGVSGSSIADAAFGAKVLAPALVRGGLAPERAAAVVAATSILPNIAPPSIAFLLLASAVDLSVGSLFAGGLVAAIVLAASMSLGLWLTAAPGLREAPASGTERLQALRGALPVIGLALVILAGLRLGIVTTTEAAALAAFYALAAFLFEGRSVAVRRLPSVFADAGIETAAVALLVAAAAPFVFLLAVDDIAGLVASLFETLENPLAVLLLANLLLLLAGTVLDVGPGILLFAPLLLPVAVASGVDPVLFGVILVVNLMIGGLTWPVGVLVFVAARLSGVSPSRVFRSVLPLLVFQLLALLTLTTYAAVRAR